MIRINKIFLPGQTVFIIENNFNISKATVIKKSSGGYILQTGKKLMNLSSNRIYEDYNSAAKLLPDNTIEEMPRIHPVMLH